MTLTRLSVLATALVSVAGIAYAQQAPAKKGAPPTAKAPAPAPKAAAPAPKTPAPAAKAPAPAPRGRALTPAPEQPDTAPILMREVFDYERAGRRDPFAPLLETAELRPTLEDLRITGILVHPTRPVAVMRDKDGTQYRVTTGMVVGRARVVEIKRRAVIFAISEYGSDRRDSLVIGDTAQKRP